MYYVRIPVRRGSSSALYPFLGEGSRKKGSLVLTSLLEDLVEVSAGKRFLEDDALKEEASLLGPTNFHRFPAFTDA